MINEQLKLIGINIKAERLKKNLSQEQLAEMTNISIPTISLIETGKQNTSILNILEIASALGVDVNTLVEGI
ncbi:MAG: XRE family transcriptional regulator [Candidatus Melainabacteria bacterium]|nr:MAG: XRE family transcriptional regulator [Candidatus Melainabacteria bacterium]RAI10438.1 MAG: XRE family transcriptional regulator [Candidatus Melainabacteria bacterium]